MNLYVSDLSFVPRGCATIRVSLEKGKDQQAELCMCFIFYINTNPTGKKHQKKQGSDICLLVK